MADYEIKIWVITDDIDDIMAEITKLLKDKAMEHELEVENA